MAVYLGNSGVVEILRNSLNQPVAGTLSPSDVNVAKRRFSFDFDPSALVSGDRISIRNTSGSNLALVAGHNFPDGTWYCHIDQAGGVRLYDDYADALNGGMGRALPLVQGAADQPVDVRGVDSTFRCVAQTRNWQLTTARENVDITSLGEDHRRFFANGLISGQGSLSCFWDFHSAICTDSAPADGRFVELPVYFSQLVLRVRQGASFKARFFMAQPETQPLQGPQAGTYVWFEATCLITSVGMAFEPTQLVESQIEFVTSGPVHLRIGRPPGILLQESVRALLQEDGGHILLENEDT